MHAQTSACLRIVSMMALSSSGAVIQDSSFRFIWNSDWSTCGTTRRKRHAYVKHAVIAFDKSQDVHQADICLHADHFPTRQRSGMF